MDEQEIIRLEEALRGSLQHVAAPEGFTQRVTARLGEREARREQRSARPGGSVFTGGYRQVAWWTAVAAMLALSAGGADLLHLHHQRDAVQAQEQVDYAMQLTTHAIDEVEMGVNRSPAGRYAQLLNETQR